MDSFINEITKHIGWTMSDVRETKEGVLRELNTDKLSESTLAQYNYSEGFLEALRLARNLYISNLKNEKKQY